MDIHTNIPLKNYTTMKLGGNARFMADAHTPQEAAALFENASKQSLPTFILGGGSNVVVHDEGFNGLIIRMQIPGFEILEDVVNSTTIKIGAGEQWDSVVERTVEMNLSGIETMSAIPGTAGAAPVQNVGAYGQEIADTLQSLEAYDTQTKQFVVLTNQDCGFSYRNSIFRSEAKGRYIITSITLKLLKSPLQPPFYDSLQKYIDDNHISFFTPQTIRDAVIAIRADKLPDPNKLPNSGSFFKNAIVEGWVVEEIRRNYPDLKTFDMSDGQYKIPTGWLIEKAGLKGQLLHGMRVHDKNALVLINESATSYADLAAAREQIIIAVRDKFRVEIQQEPLEI